MKANDIEQQKTLNSLDAQERRLEQELADLRERRREFINKNELNGKVGK